MYLVLAPCVVAFTLELLFWVCSGDAATSALRKGNAEARLAFAWSMLLVCFAVLVMLAIVGPVALWRMLRGHPLGPPPAGDRT